jgi:putative salt-induced outer membrane protein YdiY
MRSRISIALSVLLAAGSIFAADEPPAEPKRPWTDAAELGLVMTSGNAEGTNYAFSNKFKYTFSHSELTCDAAALRTESRTRTIDNPPPFGTAVVTDTTQTTAAIYGVGAKYRHDITDRFFWYVGASWYQNFFAGIDDRYIAGAGLGYTVVKGAKNTLKLELGADYTREDPLGNPPPVALETDDFAGVRGFLGYELKFSEKSKLTEDLNLFANLETSDAWRANSVTAITAGFTNSLAVKVSYAIAYSNQPPVRVIPANPGPGPDAIYEFEDTDTILTAALVINF